MFSDFMVIFTFALGMFAIFYALGVFSKDIVVFLYNLSPRFRGWVDTMVSNVED